MTTDEQIADLTKSPYKYAVKIEYDREVITVIVYDNWMNKTVYKHSSSELDLETIVDGAYSIVCILREGEK